MNSANYNQNFKIRLQVLSDQNQSAPSPSDSQHIMSSQLDQNDQVEIALYCKNIQTLEEFACRVFFRPDYVQKLEKWISKKRYICNLVNKKQLHLTVEIFSFILDKIERDDIEVLKDEFKALKQMSDNLDQEVALFNYQFFGTTWNEQTRKRIEVTLGDQHRRDLVDSVGVLFDKFQVIGYNQVEESGLNKSYVLIKDQLPIEGKASPAECLLQVADDVSTPQIINMARKAHNTVTMEESNGMNQQYAMFEVDSRMPIRHEQRYELSISKMPQKVQ